MFKVSLTPFSFFCDEHSGSLLYECSSRARDHYRVFLSVPAIISIDNAESTQALSFTQVIATALSSQTKLPYPEEIHMIILVIVYDFNVPRKQIIAASPHSFYTSPGKPLQPSPKVLLAHQTQRSPQHLALKCDHNR